MSVNPLTRTGRNVIVIGCLIAAAWVALFAVATGGPADQTHPIPAPVTGNTHVTDAPAGQTLPGLATATPGTVWTSAGPGDSVCRAPGDCGYGDNGGNGDHWTDPSDHYAVCDQTIAATTRPGACRASFDSAVAPHMISTAPAERDAFESFDWTQATDANGYVTTWVELLTRVDQCQVTVSEPISGPGTVAGAACFVSGPPNGHDTAIRVRVFRISPTGTVVPAAREQVTVMVLGIQHVG